METEPTEPTQGTEPCALAARCCDKPEAVFWNPLNGVVQCHACGHVWVPCVYPPAPEPSDRTARESPSIAKE